MAKRVVNGLERVLRAAVGLGLAEADIRQFPLHHVDDGGIHLRLRRRRAEMTAGIGERCQIGVLALEMVQDVLQRVLDAAEIVVVAGTARESTELSMRSSR